MRGEAGFKYFFIEKDNHKAGFHRFADTVPASDWLKNFCMCNYGPVHAAVTKISTVSCNGT